MKFVSESMSFNLNVNMQKEASVTSFVISLQFLTNFFLLQLKNNIAALYSSRARGTKSFQKDGVQFGWQPIIDQYECDQTRAEQNLARRVPGLRYSFVHRDSWTRLNVLPAKIMQVGACAVDGKFMMLIA